MHDEHNDLLLMNITLSSLGNHSFLVSLSLAGLVSMNIFHVKLDVERVNKLNLLLSFTVSVLLKQLSDLVFSISEHH